MDISVTFDFLGDTHNFTVTGEMQFFHVYVVLGSSDDHLSMC